MPDSTAKMLVAEQQIQKQEGSDSRYAVELRGAAGLVEQVVVSIAVEGVCYLSEPLLGLVELECQLHHCCCGAYSPV